MSPHAADCIRHLSRWKPLIVLVYLSSGASLATLAVQGHLGLRFDPLFLLVMMGLTFFIYTINRYSDLKEDLANDASKVDFFARNSLLLPMAIAAGVLSLACLAIVGTFGWLHILIVALGIAYSYPILPLPGRDRGIRFLRIKQIPLLKAPVVALCWSISIVFFPMLQGFGELRFEGPWLAIAAGVFLACITSATFFDLEDIHGDAIAGNPTFPVVLGRSGTFLLLAAAHALWLIALFVGSTRMGLDGPHLGLLVALALSPLASFLPRHLGWLPQSVTDWIADIWIFLLAAGLALITSLAGGA